MKELRKIAAIETHENVKIEYETANVGSRMLAYLLDIIILYGTLTVIVITLVVLFINDLAVPDLDFAFNNLYLYLAIYLLVCFLLENFYFIFFERILKGQTPGKKAARIRVVMTTGEPVTFMASVIRNFFRIADELPAANLVGGVLVFFGKRSQRLGDRIGNTMVIKSENLKRFSKYIDTVAAGAEKAAEKEEQIPDASSVYADRTFEEEKTLVREFLARAKNMSKKLAEENRILLFRVISKKLSALNGETAYRIEKQRIPEFLQAFAQGEDASTQFTAEQLAKYCVSETAVQEPAGAAAQNDSAPSADTIPADTVNTEVTGDGE